MSLQIAHFSGIAPKTSARQLRPDMAQIANNCRLIGGDLRAFKALLSTPSNTLQSGTKTIFRMDNGATDYWLSWAKIVNAVRGQVASDTDKKIYWTGDNEPRCASLSMVIAGGGIMPASCFVLGVSPPTTAFTVTPSGGTGLAETRAYVETFVTPWGEESAPGPVSAVKTGKVDDTWALAGLNPVPINTSTISAATSTSGITTITTASTAHLRAGEEVTHANVVGMTDLNGKFVILNVVDATHYQVTLTTAQVYSTLLATPVNAAFSTATTGGTLAAGTYWYRVSAINSIGETLASTETSKVTTGTTSTVTVNWGAVAGATGYKVYGRTTGAELLMATVGAVTTWIDTGAVIPAGALPAANTTASGGNWTRVASHNTTGMTRRIYRTVNTDYYFVVELPIATTSYNDTIADTALGEVLPSTGWLMPPVTMTGLISLPNGSMAGINGDTICFSEPWSPYAWPIAYQQSSNFPVVALGAFGSSVVVGTTGMPSIITGSDPGQLSIEKTEVRESCLSALGMVDVGSGVMYPSKNGMAFIGLGGANMGTKMLYSKDEWALLNVSTLRCVWHANMLYGWHDINADLHTGFVMDLTDESFSTLSIAIDTCYVDDETNRMYIVQSGALYEWDEHPYNTLTFDWKSKKFAMQRPIMFGYAMVDAELTGVADSNAAIAADTAFNANLLALGNAEAAYNDVNIKGSFDASMLDEFMLDGSNLRGGSSVEITAKTLRVTVYIDGVARYTENVTSGKSFSISPGRKGQVWEFRLGGNINAYSLIVAESALGLRQ